MKREMRHDLTASDVQELLDYDPLTGVFRWRRPNKPAGTQTAAGYIEISIRGRGYLAHRLAWLYVHGHWPKFQIDHIDRVKGNNRILNLRDVPGSVNTQNQAVPRGRNSLIGTHFDRSKNRWSAQISLAGKTYRLGRFRTELQAHEAYVAAKRRLHAGCTI